MVLFNFYCIYSQAPVQPRLCFPASRTETKWKNNCRSGDWLLLIMSVWIEFNFRPYLWSTAAIAIHPPMCQLLFICIRWRGGLVETAMALINIMWKRPPHDILNNSYWSISIMILTSLQIDNIFAVNETRHRGKIQPRIRLQLSNKSSSQVDDRSQWIRLQLLLSVAITWLCSLKMKHVENS